MTTLKKTLVMRERDHTMRTMDQVDHCWAMHPKSIALGFKGLVNLQKHFFKTPID